MTSGQVVPGSLYVYIPNKGAPIFFTIAFASSAVGYIWQCLMIGLQPFCAVLFTVGYAMRAYGAYGHHMYNSQNLVIYILSQVFIYICPPLLELANYHVLGRIFYYVPNLAPLPPDKVLAIFGGLMALVEALNALGVAFNTNPTGTQQELGKVLILAALALQLCVIAVFVAITGSFHWRCVKAKIRRRSLPTLLVMLNISMALILIRCIYRLVEHVGNTSVDLNDPEKLRTLSPLLRYEWFFYIFEASLMLLNSLLWNVFNPGRHLPRHHTVFLAANGTTEIEEVQVQDDKPVFVKAAYVAMNILTFNLFRLFARHKDEEGHRLTERNKHSRQA
ncbi:hypothetical protein EYZ11_000225 [Aspergillus tanneri]|uniref:RTA1 domain protein n=1 Tax=Aspergillus tanneri TaxID=1220188 RepID=A0A4S3JXQ0_9EURO|nr:hypothetical protein EYZ11_000225 [Aspergillus tanneri]